jgi:hypothetical protein
MEITFWSFRGIALQVSFHSFLESSFSVLKHSQYNFLMLTGHMLHNRLDGFIRVVTIRAHNNMRVWHLVFFNCLPDADLK